jgi:adenosine deaminase
MLRDTTEQKKAYQEAVAMIEFGPDRLGHALLLPSSLRQHLNQRRIPVETCPTSNVMTLELAKVSNGNLLRGMTQHPALGEWLETGYPITIATDDPGVFCTALTKELLLVKHAFNLTNEQLQELMYKSMDYAFCDDVLKDDMKERIRQRMGKI